MAPSEGPPAAVEPAERHHTKAEWDAIVAAADRSSTGGGAVESSAPPSPWPPRVGEPFPPLVLRDHTGALVSLAALRGKVLLIEPVGMDCPACQAFSGAHARGGWSGVRPQAGLPSLHELVEDAGHEIGRDGLVLVQLLLYAKGRKRAPTLAEAAVWAEHFGLAHRPGHHVLVGTEGFLGRASYDMIPGVFLVDRDGVLVKDSTGHRPRHSLRDELLPALSSALAQPARVSSRAQARPPSGPRVSSPLSVSAAYAAIPHRRTVFDPSDPAVEGETAEYLEAVFALMDDGVRVRVHALAECSRARCGQSGATGAAELRALAAAVAAVPAPSPLLVSHRDEIVDAVTLQAEAFAAWSTAGLPESLGKSAPVRAASSKLRSAWQRLERELGAASPENHHAFFDHHCALDFL